MLSFYLMLLEGDDDRELFAQIYIAHERMMYSVAYSILHSQMAAQDAVHNSFIKVIEHFETCKKMQKDETAKWLLVIVKHSAFDIRKKEAENELADASLGYSELIEMVQTLPDIYRSVLELKYVAEWSDDEIAKELHLNRNTIRSRLMRGRNLLKESLCSTQPQDI